MKLLVFTDTVKNHHCIVDCITDDGKDGRDECLVDVKAERKYP